MIKLFFIILVVLIIFRPAPVVTVERGTPSVPVEANTQVTPSPTVTTGAVMPKGEIERLICEYWKDDCEVALAVARCESGLRPHAVGDHALTYMQDGVEYGKSYGVFQIRHLPGRPDPSNLLITEFNINYAHKLYKRSGFQPWSAYTNQCYLAFLK